MGQKHWLISCYYIEDVNSYFFIVDKIRFLLVHRRFTVNSRKLKFHGESRFSFLSNSLGQGNLQIYRQLRRIVVLCAVKGEFTKSCCVHDNQGGFLILKTYGCQTNFRMSEAIKYLLLPTSPRDAKPTAPPCPPLCLSCQSWLQILIFILCQSVAKNFRYLWRGLFNVQSYFAGFSFQVWVSSWERSPVSGYRALTST